MTTAPTDSSKQGWVRTRRERPCPVCGRTDGWCTIKHSGEVAQCMRVEEGAFKSEYHGAGLGHFHKLDKPLHSLPDPEEAPPEIDAKHIAKVCYNLCSPQMYDRIARHLNVTVESLQRLRVGWSYEHDAMTFPMRGDTDHVIGIRLRNIKGRKWAIPGSRNGIFIPRQLSGKGPLFVVEGPTDTAALLSLGFDAIGRPSDTAGANLIVWWLMQQPRRHLVIALENNEPESAADENAKRGAGDLKARCYYKDCVETVTVWRCDKAKDVREWINEGATYGDVRGAVALAYREQNTRG